MSNIFDDTLKVKGQYSQKRVMTFASFFSALIYGFIPVLIRGFDVKEFVFLGFLGAGGFSMYRTQKKNENEKGGDGEINNDTE